MSRLGREEFVPEGIEPLQRLAHLFFDKTFDLGPRRTPRANDNLRRLQETAQLVHHSGLDFGGGHAPDRACAGAALQDRLADIIAVPSLRVCVGDMAQPVGPKISPFSKAGVCARVCIVRFRGLSRRMACTRSQRARSMMA
jgi:hypothetical protein